MNTANALAAFRSNSVEYGRIQSMGRASKTRGMRLAAATQVRPTGARYLVIGRVGGPAGRSAIGALRNGARRDGDRIGVYCPSESQSAGATGSARPESRAICNNGCGACRTRACRSGFARVRAAGPAGLESHRVVPAARTRGTVRFVITRVDKLVGRPSCRIDEAAGHAASAMGAGSGIRT